MKRIFYTGMIAAGLLLQTHSLLAQTTQDWIATDPGPWNVDENWNGPPGNFVPTADFDDSASINNGGTALVTEPVDDVVNVTIGNGTLDFSGPGALTTVGNLTNNGTLRISGPDVGLQVGGNFTNNGVWVADITGATHSQVSVTGDVALGGTLDVRISGVTPGFGDSWELVSGGSVAGQFATVDSSLAPLLARGLNYQVRTTATKADLVVGNSLILNVDRTSGAGTIENAVGGPVDFDGYAILSGNGLLNGPGWTSLESAGATGWQAATPSGSSLVELNLTDSSAIAVGESIDVGNVYTGGFITPADEDVAFEYTTTDGQIVSGIVEYAGPVNDIVLAVDPATGDAEIRNLSPFSQVAKKIDGYLIQSESGSLVSADWDGFVASADAGEGWRKAPASANGLAELNLEGSKLFSSGTNIPLGTILDPAGLRDLVFEYAALGSSNPPGDADGDGSTGLTDFDILKSNFGASGVGLSEGDFDGDGSVGLTDFDILKSNFGATGGPGGETQVFTGTVVYTSLTAPAAVPEPSTVFLAGLGAVLLLLGRVRRRA